MNAVRRNIPNAVTCLNVAAGFLSLVCSMHGQDAMWGLRGYQWGWIFIGIAAVADFLDGFAARALHAYSTLGKELDSLCDLVSFGVAPAMAMFVCLESVTPGCWVKWAVVLIPVVGALRLAKFNVDTRQSVNFRGLPIPANAIFWIGYSAVCYANPESAASWYWVCAAVVALCWLMLSEVKLFSLKFKTWGWRGNTWRWILICTAPVLVFCMGVQGLMWLIVAYVCYGLFDGGDA